MIKLTGEDLRKVIKEQKLDKASINDSLLAVLNACDSEVKDWAQQYVATLVTVSELTGASLPEVIYTLLLLGLYLGASMQEGKTEQTMTVRLQFEPKKESK